MPSIYQGVHIQNDAVEPEKLIRNLRNTNLTVDEQKKQLGLLEQLNRRYLARVGDQPQLEGAVQSMESAFRLQTQAADLFDIRKEPEKIRERYDISDFGRGCLMALRLVESGVRMVQIYYGASQPWDAHEDIQSHKAHARNADPAVASLIEDLKERGLLDQTLVVLGTEFGRTPAVQNSSTIKLQNGRDHNSLGFTVLMAGGGVKGGTIHGATDDFGYRAVDKPVHVHDLNATILHLMGLDHTKLIHHYSGRDFRLTDVHGNVVRDIMA
jgi:membrane-anchored protein YejM (alkaline phosphatase superfamily)